MTIRALNLTRPVHAALLAAMLLVPFAGAHAQATSTGQRAYWCKSPNGSPVLQTESCPPGKELRSEPVGPYGRVAPPPVQQTAGPEAGAAPRAAAAPRTAPAEQESVTSLIMQPRGMGRAVLVLVLMLFGLGLVVWLIRKLRTRSF